MKIIVLLLLTLTLISCKKHDLTKDIGEEITICFEEKGTIKDNENQVELKFIHLVEDSRCPEGVQCIWAGRAVVEIRINSTYKITLGIGDLTGATNTPYVNFVEYNNYRITLLEVTYNKKKHQGKEEKYQIKLRVDKK
jgi:hypothetical protein